MDRPRLITDVLVGVAGTAHHVLVGVPAVVLVAAGTVVRHRVQAAAPVVALAVVLADVQRDVLVVQEGVPRDALVIALEAVLVDAHHVADSNKLQ